MTGRRLYEIVTDERAAQFGKRGLLPWVVQNRLASTSLSDSTPPAWAFLSKEEQSVWNATARRIKKGRRS